MDWKAIYGDKESLTLAEIEAATASMKLADLATGEYVAKAKFDALKKVSDDLAKERDELKTKTEGDDGLEGKLKALTDQLTALEGENKAAAAKLLRSERAAIVSAQITNPKLAKLALIEAEAITSDDMPFDAALAKIIKDDPEYTTPGATVKTGGTPKGEPQDEDAYKTALDAAFASFDPPKKE